jgi:hypothetical protein
MDYEGFPAVPPRMVSDTATWKVPFAPVYSPPTLDLETDELAGYQRRLNEGDTSAASDWQRRVESTERRYRVPEKLRSVWIRGGSSGPAAGVAFRRTIVSSNFEINHAVLAIRLLAIGAIVLIAGVFGRTRTGLSGKAIVP